ncbi:MAG TPA: glutamate--tRNA ligase [Vicinamibacterales bacterium]|nr:glutamate--tRNA ligase [Vicinamibacterales bacterium]
MPRVRFAPSPTGFLHVGGARTALFNWLYARRHGGTFILRIEDTDADRSSEEMVAGILSSLTWLGLDWDEGPGVGGPHGPYFQSQRIDRHRAAADRLIAHGHAYRCYCHPDEIAARRSAAEQGGGGWVYDRRCLSLPPEELQRYAESGMPSAVRFRVPEGRTAFDDLVRGHIDIDHATIEDFVILRSNGSPTYQLSVVVDDIDMAVTDVVRGDDHISNTPKQILLYRALEAPVPRFAHVPLILGPDKKRLSKRHGATSVGEYEAQGYLPEAMVNFLALLGWSPGGDREVLTRDELLSLFALEDISGGNAVFNVDKLDWFNQQHIMRMDAAEIVKRLSKTPGVFLTTQKDTRGLYAAIDLVKPRARKLSDIPDMLAPFVSEDVELDPAAVTKHLSLPDLAPHLAAWRDRLVAVDPFTPENLETALRDLAGARGIKPGVLIHATRVAVTGQAVSPGIFEVLALVGPERVLRRLDRCIK